LVVYLTKRAMVSCDVDAPAERAERFRLSVVHRAMSDKVEHNESEHRFQLRTPNGVAVLDYTDQDNTWYMTHTYVPPELRGQGVAAAVVKRALEEARARGKKVSPDCTYVEAYIERHNEYKDLLAPC
jgi:predicted GNAT family acetyltransferase